MGAVPVREIGIAASVRSTDERVGQYRECALCDHRYGQRPQAGPNRGARISYCNDRCCVACSRLVSLAPFTLARATQYGNNRSLCWRRMFTGPSSCCVQGLHRVLVNVEANHPPSNNALKPTSRIGAIFGVWMRNTVYSIHRPPSAGWLSAGVGRASHVATPWRTCPLRNTEMLGGCIFACIGILFAHRG
jgi:hypothetical protein